MIKFVVLLSIFLSCNSNNGDKYIFFLHNRFLETNDLQDSHTQFGRVHYSEILDGFREAGFVVISEIRNGNVNAREYALQVNSQIDSLLRSGTLPGDITVVGTSKGGYIAQYVSTLMNNPKLNYVFIACFQNSDIEQIPEIKYCGNILSIHDQSDPFGVSALARKNLSTCNILHYKEVELNTGLGHGFLFQPLKEWMIPTIEWSKGNYEF